MTLGPGARTFVTAYAMNEAVSYGDGFYAERVFPLLLMLDNLVGQRAEARHGDWKRDYRKRTDRLAFRILNLVDDRHRRVAYDPVQAFDVILLPSFGKRDMSTKSDRKIRTRTVRSMLGLAHDRVRQKLAWMCRKCGKRLVIAMEAYASRSRSWDGIVEQEPGDSKTVSDGTIIVDRDMNGARGILLRALNGNLGRFQAAGADVVLVAESIICLDCRWIHLVNCRVSRHAAAHCIRGRRFAFTSRPTGTDPARSYPIRRSTGEQTIGADEILPYLDLRHLDIKSQIYHYVTYANDTHHRP